MCYFFRFIMESLPDKKNEISSIRAINENSSCKSMILFVLVLAVNNLVLEKFH